MARRKQDTRKLRKQIYIIGEGITEQIYFNQLRISERLSIRIKPEIPYSTDITGIIKKAEVYKNASPANKVFCVIYLDRIHSDKAEKKKYVNIKKNHNNSKQIFFFETNPCFEFWFLLHFEYSSREYANCKNLTGKLIKCIPDYSKTEEYLRNKNLYNILKEKLPEAVSNSKKLEENHVNTKCDIYKIIENFNINNQNYKQ